MFRGRAECGIRRSLRSASDPLCCQPFTAVDSVQDAAHAVDCSRLIAWGVLTDRTSATTAPHLRRATPTRARQAQSERTRAKEQWETDCSGLHPTLRDLPDAALLG